MIQVNVRCTLGLRIGLFSRLKSLLTRQFRGPSEGEVGHFPLTTVLTLPSNDVPSTEWQYLYHQRPDLILHFSAIFFLHSAFCGAESKTVLQTDVQTFNFRRKLVLI